MKKLIRKEKLSQRISLSYEETKNTSLKIVNKIRKSSYYLEAKCVGIYLSINKEVDVSALLSDDKTFCVPRVLGDKMDFYEIDLNSQTHKGAFNIIEPTKTRIVDSKDIDMLIVPLIAYDDMCNRIGYGKGYYDKYLKEYRGRKIGVAYAFQRTQENFANELDIRLDEIITEE